MRLADWEQDREHIRRVAKAGATWRMEFIELSSLEKIYQDNLNRRLRIEG